MAEEANATASTTPVPGGAAPAGAAATPTPNSAAGGIAPAGSAGAAAKPADAGKPTGKPSEMGPPKGTTAGEVTGGAAPNRQKPDVKAEKEPPKSPWPENWRLEMARGDKARLDELERLGSPADVYDALRSLRQKVSNGELKSGKLPKNATPEQIAAYRKEHGVPDSPAGYYEKIEALNPGLAIGEEDRPIIDQIFGAVHAEHGDPRLMNTVLSAYYKAREKQIDDEYDADMKFRNDSSDQFHRDWGPEYRKNKAATEMFLGQVFGEALPRFLGGRTADGRIIGDDAEFIRPMLRLAVANGYGHTTVGHEGIGNTSGAMERIAQIQKMMGDRESEYYKGPSAERIQQEYRDLITFRDRNGAKAA